MYKVFFNDSCIQLDAVCKTSFKDNIVFERESLSYDFVNQLVLQIENAKSNADFLILNQEVNRIWNEFKICFCEIPAAGGLVRNNDGSLLFIKRLGVWDLPKGKIEKLETADQAAIREVEEECGVSGLQLVKKLDSTFHIYRSPYLAFPRNLVLKETNWYLMTYSGSEIPVPQVEEDIEEVRWFRFSELDEVMDNTYASIREFLKLSLPVI